MNKVIGVLAEGAEVEWHAPGVIGDYDTLCGLDANPDPESGMRGKVLPNRGKKITCGQCAAIFLGIQAMGLRRSNFDLRALIENGDTRFL